MRVPFLVYMSPSLRREVPKLWEQILRAQGEPLMTDLLPNTLVAMLGIQTPYTRPELDLFSPRYNANRRRTVIAVDGAKQVFPPRSVPSR